MNFENVVNVMVSSKLLVPAISGLAGVVTGTGIKFIFEKVISRHFDKIFDLNEVFNSYAYPLMQSAQALNRRLEFLIESEDDREYYVNDSNGVYKISFLYFLASFFGWCKIIEQEALSKFHTQKSISRHFYIVFYNVYKSLASYFYFKSMQGSLGGNYDRSALPKLIIQGIGESVVKNTDPTTQYGYSIVGFIEFNKLYKENKDLKKWLTLFDDILMEAFRDDRSYEYNRLVLIAINIRILVNYIDTKLNGFHLPKNHLEYTCRLDPEVREAFMADYSALLKNKIVRPSPILDNCFARLKRKFKDRIGRMIYMPAGVIPYLSGIVAKWICRTHR